MNYDRLRLADVERQAEWPGGERADLAFRGLELGGEVGELLNLVKKRVRLERDIAGTTETRAKLQDELRDELGDVIICLDLCGMGIGVPVTVPRSVPLAGRHDTLTEAGNRLFYCAGRAALATCEDAPSEAETFIGYAMFYAMQLGALLDIEPWRAVELKFNKTSEKHGLATRF